MTNVSKLQDKACKVLSTDMRPLRRMSMNGRFLLWMATLLSIWAGGKCGRD